MLADHMGAHVNWRVVPAAGLTAVVVYVVLPTPELRRALYHAVLLACVAVLAVQQRRFLHPMPWRYLAGGLGLFVLHSLMFDHGPTLPGQPLFDAGLFLCGYVLLLIGSLRLIRICRPEGDREGLIDGLIVAIAVALVMWEALGISGPDAASPLLDRLIVAGFPLLQAVLAAIAVRLLLVGAARLPSAWLLVAAVFAGMAANVAYALAEQQPAGYQPGRWIDLLWIVGYVAAATAILHPSSRALTQVLPTRGRGLPWGRVVTLGAALVCAPVVVVAHLGMHPAVIASFLLIVLVLWRLVGLIAERERARGELDARAHQHKAVAALGLRALKGGDLPDLFEEIVRTIQRELVVERVALLEALPDEKSLVLHAGRGWSNAEKANPSAASCSQHAFCALRLEAPVLVFDLGSERRFDTAALLAKGLRSGVAVVIGGRTRPFGVLTIHSVRPRPFSDDDVVFLQSLANAAASAIERTEAEGEIRRQALHDPLTGLPNRTLLLDRLAREINTRRQCRAGVALLFIDLDRFKEVNDRFGHDAGDRLLVAVANRLRATLRPQDTLGRFAGDEFLVVCPDVDAAGARMIADRLSAALAHPPAKGEADTAVSASIGIVIGNPWDDPDELVRQADAAMYRAKENGRQRWELFDDALRAATERRSTVERDLPGAAARGELRLAYQPLMTLDGAVTGVEGLLRWRHPRFGLIGPSECIPTAEARDTVSTLGSWVISEACQQLASWKEVLPASRRLEMFVNMSARQLGDPELVRSVEMALERSGCDPDLLCLEVTESALLPDDDIGVPALRALRAMGVHVALDDFGAGYSSLGRLRRLPVDIVKIDGSFVAEADQTGGGSTIVRAITNLAHSLGIMVVAEGVETAAQLAMVRAAGCDRAQGHFFAEALEPAEVCTLLLRDAPASRRQLVRGPQGPGLDGG